MEQPKAFRLRLREAIRPHISVREILFLAVPAILVVLYVRSDAEAMIRMLEAAGVASVILAYLIWALIRMEPELEPARRRFLLSALSLAGVSLLGFGRLSAPKKEPATPEELTQTFIHGRVVRIGDVTGSKDVIKGKIFEECDIYGPAILVVGDDPNTLPSGLIENSFDAAGRSFEEIVIGIQYDADWPLGGIMLEDCQFKRCNFHLVGFAVPASKADQFRFDLACRGWEGINPSSPPIPCSPSAPTP